MFTCAEVDLKGLPEWATKSAMKDMGLRINHLRKHIPKWKKQFPGDDPN